MVLAKPQEEQKPEEEPKPQEEPPAGKDAPALKVGDRVLAEGYPGEVVELPEEGENAGKVMFKAEDGKIYPMEKADVKAQEPKSEEEPKPREEPQPAQTKAQWKIGDRVVAKYSGKDYPGSVESLPQEGETDAGKVLVKVDEN